MSLNLSANEARKKGADLFNSKNVNNCSLTPINSESLAPFFKI